jgi:hypothetical protein
MNARLLRSCDAVGAARRLKGLYLSEFYAQRLWGVLGPVSSDGYVSTIAEGVDIFLQAFAPEASA